MSKSVSWKGGRDMGTLRLRVHEAGENLKARAVEALEVSIEEGAWDLQDRLEKAVTPTGERREATRGGFPGRHDTGNMVGSISYEVRDRRSRRVQGVFGWWGANFEEYFKEQDLTISNPAHALFPAFVKAREAFRGRMRRVVRGESAGK